MDMQMLGKRIAHQRQNKAYTQEELALKLGVTSQAVSKWERGSSSPDIGLLAQLCQVLEVSSDELLGLDTVDDRREEDFGGYLGFLYAEPLELIIGYDLIPMVSQGLETDTIPRLRMKLARTAGVLLPAVRIRDDGELAGEEYVVRSYGMELYHGKADPGDEMAFRKVAEQLGQAAEKNYAHILNREMVKTLVDAVKEHFPAVVEGVVPEKISYGELQRECKARLQAGKDIRNFIGIIEELEDRHCSCKETEQM